MENLLRRMQAEGVLQHNVAVAEPRDLPLLFNVSLLVAVLQFSLTVLHNWHAPQKDSVQRPAERRCPGKTRRSTSCSAGTAAVVFIDNNGVLGSLLKDSSRALKANMLTRRIWLHAAEWSWAPVWARIESAANIADGPSRRDFTHAESPGAEWVAPVLPQ